MPSSRRSHRVKMRPAPKKPSEPQPPTPARVAQFEKSLKEHPKTNAHIMAMNAQALENSYSRNTMDSIQKGYNYPPNPFSWKKFSVLGVKFERVWWPARLTAYAVTLPFRLAFWPVSFSGRFIARTIAKNQLKANFVEKARKLAEKDKSSLTAAKKKLRVQQQRDAQYRNTRAFKESIKPKEHQKARARNEKAHEWQKAKDKAEKEQLENDA